MGAVNKQGTAFDQEPPRLFLFLAEGGRGGAGRGCQGRASPGEIRGGG